MEPYSISSDSDVLTGGRGTTFELWLFPSLPAMKRSLRVKMKIKTLASPERLNRNSVARVAADGMVFGEVPNPLTQRTMLVGVTMAKYTTG